MMTRDRIEALSAISTPEWPTISLYLRIDKERIDEDFTIRLKNLLSDAAENLDGDLSREQRTAVVEDLELIREFVRDQHRRYGRGVALFVNSHAGLFEAVEIPAQVESSITIGTESNVVPLIKFREQLEPYCTCLISRDQSRVFFGEMGRLEEISVSRDDMVPGQHEQGGWSQSRYVRHIEEHVRAHFKQTANQLFKLAQERPFRLLVLGGPEEVVASFVEFLHPYVRERHVGSVRLLMEANVNEVRQDSCEVIDRWTNEEKQRVINALRNQAPSGELRATGIGDTISALQRGQIMSLILDSDFAAPGSICQQCGSLQEQQDSHITVCSFCGGPLLQIDNIVPRVVRGAFGHGARVIFLDSDDHRRQAAEFGGIGALLRFAVEAERSS